MNAYKRRGLTESDILDYARANRRMGARGRLALNNFYLMHAADLRFERMRDNALWARGMRVIRDSDPALTARRYIAKAREWRLELRGAL